MSTTTQQGNAAAFSTFNVQKAQLSFHCGRIKVDEIIRRDSRKKALFVNSQKRAFLTVSEMKLETLECMRFVSCANKYSCAFNAFLVHQKNKIANIHCFLLK
jgi:hypothetical protein